MVDPTKIMQIGSALADSVIETVRLFGGDHADTIAAAEMAAAMILVECTTGPETDDITVPLFAEHVADLVPAIRKAIA